MRTGSMRVAEIALPALRHNVRRIRELTGGQVIAVLKANAYGHGAELVARAAVQGGATMLGVADLEEAVALRAHGVDVPILCWLHGAHADFEAAVEHDIEIGVSQVAQLEALARAARRIKRASPTSVQIKVDTGLSRNGAAPAHWQELFTRATLLERGGVLRVRGIFSHLANAGIDADNAQAARFDEAVALLRAAGGAPELIHLAASAATLSSSRFHYNTVRVGIAVYGLSPFDGRTSAEFGLIPAMTLRSEIVALRRVSAGTGVSYGFTYTAQQDTTLALVPIGYADGMPRALNGAGATVEIAGHRCPIIGRIGMDQCIVDVGVVAARVCIGDPVVLFGDPGAGRPSVETWAQALQTINYEVVAGIGQRVRRLAVDDAERVEVSQVLQIEDAVAMHDLGVRLGSVLRAGDLVILTGPLGAGKTTFAQGIGAGLGVRGPVTSPTFVLARTHPSLTGGVPLIHVDAYRIADTREFDDLDLDFAAAVVVVEWGADVVGVREHSIEVVIERPKGRADSWASNAQPHSPHGEQRDEAGCDDELDEPRTVTVTGHGVRWAKGVF